MRRGSLPSRFDSLVPDAGSDLAYVLAVAHAALDGAAAVSFEDDANFITFDIMYRSETGQPRNALRIDFGLRSGGSRRYIGCFVTLWPSMMGLGDIQTALLDGLPCDVSKFAQRLELHEALWAHCVPAARGVGARASGDVHGRRVGSLV